jgi:5-methylcytosine-specific restriction endonuclease McrA
MADYAKARRKLPEVKAQQAEYARQYNQIPENRERSKERGRKRRQSPEAKLKAKQYRDSEEGKAWRKKWLESEKGREITQARRQSDEYKAWMKQWKQSEAGKLSMARSDHKRRMCEKETLATLTDQEWEDIKKHYKYRCVYCGEKKPLTRDHIIPASKGGAFTKDNVVPACKSCNSVKRDKPVLLQLIVDPTHHKIEIDESPPKTTKLCTKCKLELPFSRFTMRKGTFPIKYNSSCKECNRIATAEYRKTDEYKQQIAIYKASDEFKKRMATYKASESGKAKMRAYWQSDKAKEKIRAYQASEKGQASLKRNAEARKIREQYHKSGIFCIAM